MANGLRPIQTTSLTEKNKKDSDGISQWGKDNVNYFIECSDFSIKDTRKDRILRNYHIYNNIIPEDWFHYVTNPLNSDKEEYLNFPSRIRPYNIIRPNIEMYLGEFIERNFKFMVMNLSKDAYNEYQNKLGEEFSKNIYQRYINELNELGVDTQQKSEEIQLPEEIESLFGKKYQDIRALKGQRRVEAIEREKNTFKLFKKLFKDYVIAGECYTYKNVERDDLTYERVSPLDISYGTSPDLDFVEDSDWVVRRKIVNPSEIVDKWYDQLKKEQHEYLELQSDYRFNNRRDFFNRLVGEEEDLDRTVTLYHVCWTSRKRLGTLSFYDDFGQPQEEIVEDGFKMPDELKETGATLEWDWVNEEWEGYRIDDKFWFDIRPIPIQRNALNNFSYCKKPYNGTKWSDTHSKSISIVDLGTPYQVLYIIINYHIERTIAKSKGKIALLDINAIPDQEGWDEEKFFYYAEATGWGLLDRNKVGVDKSFNQYTTLDFTLYEHISQLIGIKESVRNDYDELLGINRQRKGQTTSSDSVGGNQQAEFRSSIMSEMLFSDFDDFRLSEYQGMLDYSKFTHLKGKKGLWYRDDMAVEAFNIEPSDIMESELGIKAVNSPRDMADLNNFKQYAHAFAQNQAKPREVLEIVRSRSLNELDNKLADMEKVQQSLDQALSQNEEESASLADERRKEFEQFRADLENISKTLDHDRLDNREIIKGEIEKDIASNSPIEVEGNEENIADIEQRANERLKNLTTEKKNMTDASLKSEELDIKRDELKLKNKDIDTKLKIAKENKNKYDSK